ncbi:MAG: LysR family transcriptional regulator [Nocardioides sp.]|nr:LysR family transcriptional regulator [Nocardioides sp.]
MSGRLRVGFVEGATPDKWARRWRDQRPERLDLVPLTEEEQGPSLRSGEVDMVLARLPLDDGAADDLHQVRLYDEAPVAVAGREHVIAAADPVDGVTTDDLLDDQLVRPHPSGWRPTAEQLDWPAMGYRDAVETVAAGTGVVVVPMSVARLHGRKDVVHRPVTDLDPSVVALVWLRDRDSDVTQAFVGVARGRTSRSSR